LNKNIFRKIFYAHLYLNTYYSVFYKNSQFYYNKTKSNILFVATILSLLRRPMLFTDLLLFSDSLRLYIRDENTIDYDCAY